ncbi:MAG TPA: hypothetical protein VJ810_13050 [Blastocatellia bacterium]|nr:hypothetical protein [Blastocatellia bacterium]
MRKRKSKKSKSRPPERPGADEAVFHLRLIQHGTHIVELYEKFFPAEFKRDGIDYSSFRSLLASYDSFADLVNSKLFPVHNFSSNDMLYEEPEPALDTMSLCLHSFETYLWLDRSFDGAEVSLVERMIVSAAGHRIFPDIDLKLPKDWRFSPEKLQEACWKEKGMLSRLWLAAMAVLGGTGVCWLDYTLDDYYAAEPPEWSEAEIRFLAGEFKEARRINKSVEEFFAWADSPAKVEKIKRLLRQAQYVDRPRVLVQTHSGKPLIETLGGVL